MRTDDCEAQGHRKLGGRYWWKDRMLSDMVDCPGDNQQAAKGRAEIRKGNAVLERQAAPGQGQRLQREGLDAGGRRLREKREEALRAGGPQRRKV